MQMRAWLFRIQALNDSNAPIADILSFFRTWSKLTLTRSPSPQWPRQTFDDPTFTNAVCLA
jgi:hypothetical protein